MTHQMTPGEAAFYRKNPARNWMDLTDEERATWERGATMAPVNATLRVQLTGDTLRTR